MRAVGVVQARTGAPGPPGTVLRRLGDRTVLGWVVRAARDSAVLDDLVVATTRLAEDDAVAAECQRLGVRCIRGADDDVLSRFVRAVQRLDAGAEGPTRAVLRLKGNCPLVDPAIIAAAVRTFAVVPGLDYLSTALVPSLPKGLDVEVVGAAALQRAGTAAGGAHRRHVTSYVYCHPTDFRLLGLSFPPDRSTLRLAVRSEADLRTVQAVVAHFGDVPVPVDALVRWLRENPARVPAMRDPAMADA